MSDHQHGFFGSLSDAFSTDVKFTITDGNVTGLERVFGTKTVAAHLPADATFTVASGTVTETLAHQGATATLKYTADASDSSLYHLTQETTTFDATATDARTFGFTIDAGKVTAVSTSHGDADDAHSVAAAAMPATSFALDGTTVTETKVHGNTLETLTFTSADGAAYHLASETLSFVAAGSATTLLDVEPAERMQFTLDGGSITAAQAVRPDGSTADLPAHPGGHAEGHSADTVAYTQPAAGYVVETVTHGAHSTYEVFHDGNGDGVYTAVAHGAGTSVDLVGLQAQITATIDGLL